MEAPPRTSLGKQPGAVAVECGGDRDRDAGESFCEGQIGLRVGRLGEDQIEGDAARTRGAGSEPRALPTGPGSRGGGRIVRPPRRRSGSRRPVASRSSSGGRGAEEEVPGCALHRRQPADRPGERPSALRRPRRGSRNSAGFPERFCGWSATISEHANREPPVRE